MPIKPENKGLYPKDWPIISNLVKELADWKCAKCGKPHGEDVFVVGGGLWSKSIRQGWRDAVGQPIGGVIPFPMNEIRQIRVILTTSHKDHDPANCKLSNLSSLCQRCHLIYDKDHHRESRRKSIDEKNGQVLLF